jgi:tape measure domain-containing protein
MRDLGNAAGGNGEILNRLVDAYGKVQAKGRASLEELNRFTEAGVPLMKQLAADLEMTNEELFKFISAGKLGFEEVNKSLQNMTRGEGQFAGMLEEQSKTLNGLMSTLKGSMQELGRDMVSGFIPGIKGVTTVLIDWLDNINEAKASAKEINDLINTGGAGRGTIPYIGTQKAAWYAGQIAIAMEDVRDFGGSAEQQIANLAKNLQLSQFIVSEVAIKEGVLTEEIRNQMQWYKDLVALGDVRDVQIENHLNKQKLSADEVKRIEDMTAEIVRLQKEMETIKTTFFPKTEIDKLKEAITVGEQFRDLLMKQVPFEPIDTKAVEEAKTKLASVTDELKELAAQKRTMAKTLGITTAEFVKGGLGKEIEDAIKILLEKEAELKKNVADLSIPTQIPFEIAFPEEAKLLADLQKALKEAQEKLKPIEIPIIANVAAFPQLIEDDTIGKIGTYKSAMDAFYASIVDGAPAAVTAVDSLTDSYNRFGVTIENVSQQLTDAFQKIEDDAAKANEAIVDGLLENIARAAAGQALDALIEIAQSFTDITMSGFSAEEAFADMMIGMAKMLPMLFLEAGLAQLLLGNPMGWGLVALAVGTGIAVGIAQGVINSNREGRRSQEVPRPEMANMPRMGTVSSGQQVTINVDGNIFVKDELDGTIAATTLSMASNR